ncbi:PQQ-dependent sugar dehydrogenase [Litoribacillus peritrichatus]|uniref:PQQ-dependent sugar dehydrogenase n=1 Tax=Litoribacillus peritrichatus TaxID=718191 RepID=A0ABP7N8B7_9GAMM
MFKTPIFVCVLTLFSTVLTAQERQVELIISGLESPWAIEQIDDQTLIITEKTGHVGLLNLSNKKYKRIATIQESALHGQGGLLDVAVSPFAPNTLYFTYSKHVKVGYETTLAITTLKENKLVNWRNLLITQSNSDTGRHFGSRITFDDNYLFFSVGDRGVRDNGQDLSTHAGTIIRLHPDGRVPDDNPFAGQANAQPEIWSYGHRNPQGLFYDHQDKTLWSIEHGPRGGDEVNLIVKGQNYGWARASHGKEYWGPFSVGEAEELPGMESPKKVYTLSIAPSSLIFYRSKTYPELTGKLIAGALKLTHLNVLSVDEHQNITHEERILSSLNERIRDVLALKNGDILIATDEGNIYRLVP